MSVVFEGVEVPTACCFVDGEHSSFAHFEYCKFYNICKQRETIKTGFRPSDCPVKALEQEPTTKNDLGVDCISRADAITAMQDKAKKLTNEDTINGLCGAVAILYDMPSVTPQEQRWIPVSEKLPKAGEYVGDVAKYYLVQNEYGDMLVARYTHSGYWKQKYQLKPYADEIVAWMPLPKAYREVEK